MLCKRVDPLRNVKGEQWSISVELADDQDKVWRVFFFYSHFKFESIICCFVFLSVHLPAPSPHIQIDVAEIQSLHIHCRAAPPACFDDLVILTENIFWWWGFSALLYLEHSQSMIHGDVGDCFVIVLISHRYFQIFESFAVHVVALFSGLI